MIGVKGGWVVPNDIVVYLSPTDLERFHSYTDMLRARARRRRP